MPISLSYDVGPTHELAGSGPQPSGVAVLSLELGRGNAIDPAFITALHAALDEAERSEARALVITGKGRVFCGGLDLPAIHAFDRAAVEHFVDAFDGLFRRVLAFERPVVAAINGHAIAGGCVLAMACDLRVMADGPFQIGLNEVQLGIPFPPATFEIARRATPAAAQSQVILQGRRFSPAEALALGLVHRLTGERGVLADAVDEARVFAAAGPAAVRAVKADLVAPVLARIDAVTAERRAHFLDLWFGADAQGRIAALCAELLAKHKPAS
jgi:enoyl-CoA hydratase